MKRILIILSLMALVLHPISAHAASPYDGPPADLKAFENKLLASIATISCTYKKGIGFFGSYSLSQDSKDKGYNSLIVTNQSLINDCIRNSGGSVSIGLNGKNYTSSYSAFNTDGTDMATVISSLSPPEITLFDKYWPKLKGWVYVAYYVEGFGIIFRSSKVQLINELTFVIAIDNVTPTPTYGGIVFNSDGNFMGTVATIGPGTAPAGMLKVHGAPLQCAIPGSERSTITNCSGENRTQIWTIDSPSGVVTKPTPTPTPKSTAASISSELTNAQIAALSSLRKYDDSVSSCEQEFSKLGDSVLETLSDLEFLNSCNSFEIEVEDLRQKIEEFDLRSVNVTSGVSTLKRLSGEVDLLARQLTNLKIQANQAIPVLNSINQSLAEIQSWLDYTSDTWPELENRLIILPKNTQAMIKKNISFKKASTLADQLDSVSERLSESIELVLSANSLMELRESLIFVTKLKTTLKEYQNYSQTINSINKLIPNFVCTKGNLVANLPKTGKCAPTYTKTSTK